MLVNVVFGILLIDAEAINDLPSIGSCVLLLLGSKYGEVAEKWVIQCCVFFVDLLFGVPLFLCMVGCISWFCAP